MPPNVPLQTAWGMHYSQLGAGSRGRFPLISRANYTLGIYGTKARMAL